MYEKLHKYSKIYKVFHKGRISKNKEVEFLSPKILCNDICFPATLYFSLRKTINSRIACLFNIGKKKTVYKKEIWIHYRFIVCAVMRYQVFLSNT